MCHLRRAHRTVVQRISTSVNSPCSSGPTLTSVTPASGLDRYQTDIGQNCWWLSSVEHGGWEPNFNQRGGKPVRVPTKLAAWHSSCQYRPKVQHSQVSKEPLRIQAAGYLKLSGMWHTLPDQYIVSRWTAGFNSIDMRRAKSNLVCITHTYLLCI